MTIDYDDILRDIGELGIKSYLYNPERCGKTLKPHLQLFEIWHLFHILFYIRHLKDRG